MTTADGVVDDGEACDDGNPSNEDACTNECLDNVCGDGFLNMGVEQCDDGNTEDGDGCSSTCILDTCGDGVIDDGETCDDANDDDTDDCAACQLAVCGDGYVWALDAYNQAGGSIITEWEGVSAFFSGYHQTYRYPNGAQSLNWFAGQIGAGYSRGTVPITQVVPMDPLFDNVSNPFSVAGATEFFFTFYNVDNTELELLATFPGDGTANFPNGDLPCIYRGQRCGGNMIFASFDYQDDPNNMGFGDFIPNLVEAALAPPNGNTIDVCTP